MEEFEEEELYDCEIYTNEIINSEEETENVDEEKEIILLCPHCGFVYKVSDPPKDYRGRTIDINNYLLRSQEGYFRCPLCSKIVPYQFITEEEYEIIVEAKKKKEEEKQKKLKTKEEQKRKTYIKVNVAKFNNLIIFSGKRCGNKQHCVWVICQRIDIIRLFKYACFNTALIKRKCSFSVPIVL